MLETMESMEVIAITSDSDASSDGESVDRAFEVNQNKRKRTNYSKGEANANLKRAVNDFKAGLGSIREIADRYSVNKEALRRRLQNKVEIDAQCGIKPLLTRDEENVISDKIIAKSSEKDIILSNSRIKILIEKYLASKQSSVAKVSDRFVIRFVQRRPELLQRWTHKRSLILDAMRTKNSSTKLKKKSAKQTICKRCEQSGPKSSLWICCAECNHFFHVNCFRLLKEKTKKEIEKLNEWFCNDCN